MSMNNFRVILSLALLVVIGALSSARKMPQLPLYREAEASSNIRSGNYSPVSLWYSFPDELFEASVKGNFVRGDFHNVDESSRTDCLGVSVSGQKRFKSVICSGGISYDNRKEFSRRWNSTSMISDDNPFVLADSVSSDFSSDRFHVGGRVAVRPLEWMLVGLGADYTTESYANQTDPRPHNRSMRFVVTPGIDFLISRSVSAGIFAGADILSEAVSHTVVDTRENYTYFRFNGIGDYSPITTIMSMTYPRDYKGVEYKGGVHFVWDSHSSFSNSLQVIYGNNSEKARDGGVAFTFLGGDYKRTSWQVSERFRYFAKGWSHNIGIDFLYKEVKGIWYEQTPFLDSDKNNQLSFKIQESSLKNKENACDLSLSYRLDRLAGDTPDFSFTAFGTLRHSSTLHYELDGYYREYTLAGFGISASRHFHFGKNMISACLDAGYAMPLSSSQSVKEKLAVIYTNPQFEYMTARQCSGGVSLSYWRDIKGLWLGFFAEYDFGKYIGDNRYSSVLAGSCRHDCMFGVRILL